jgi:hypothetical protein
MALSSVTTGIQNVAMGYNSGNNTVTGRDNTFIGQNAASNGSYDGSIVIGSEATSTGSNQFVVGSSSVNAGAITATGTFTQSATWTVWINGVEYYIPLQAV